MKNLIVFFIISLVFTSFGALKSMPCKYPNYKCDKMSVDGTSFCEYHKCHSYGCKKQVCTKRSMYCGKFRNLKSYDWVSTSWTYISGCLVDYDRSVTKTVSIDEGEYCANHTCAWPGCAFEHAHGMKFCRFHSSKTTKLKDDWLPKSESVFVIDKIIDKENKRKEPDQDKINDLICKKKSYIYDEECLIEKYYNVLSEYNTKNMPKMMLDFYTDLGLFISKIKKENQLKEK